MSGSTEGGVDASIPLQAGRGAAQQPNPLQMIGQFAQTQNALNQNKLFPGALQLQQQAIQGGQVSLAQKINQAGYQALLPLLSQPNITHSAFTTALASVENNLGIPTSGILQDVTATTPNGDGPEFSNKVRALIASRAQISPEGGLQTVTGSPAMVSTGQTTVPGMVAGQGTANPGAFTPSGGGVPIYPPNSQLIGQVQWQDENGVTHYGTQAEYAIARGQGGRIGPAMPVSGGASAPGGVVGVNGPVSPQSPPRLATEPTGDTTGPMPGTPEYMTSMAGNAAVATERATHFATDMFPLQQAQKALEAAPTGKGSDIAHDISSVLNTFTPAWAQKGLAFISPLMTPDQVAAYDEAKKYLTQGTLGTPGATRSNEGLAAGAAASPNTQISKQAAQLVLQGMIGLRRMEQEGTLEFQNSGLAPARFGNFMSQFSTRADPRTYVFDQLTPQQRTQMLYSIKSPMARQEFISSVERSVQNGVMTPPGQ